MALPRLPDHGKNESPVVTGAFIGHIDLSKKTD
jgi:hypothetical protein